MEPEFILFFSSRRRHTRLQGDWSSDVCSSDLIGLDGARTPDLREDRGARPVEADVRMRFNPTRESARSEERRVGKEGRGRRPAGQTETKTKTRADVKRTRRNKTREAR